MPDRDNTKRPPPRKALLLVVRLAALGGGGILLLALLAVAALHLPSVQKQIIEKVVTRIERATNFKVQIRSYKLLPFSGIYLNEVKVESEGKKVLDCDKVRLKCGLSTRRPYVLVREVRLERPFLQLERSPDGKWVVPAPSVGKGQGGGPGGGGALWAGVELPKVRIVSGTIEARQQGNTVLSIKDISGAVHLKAVSGAGGPAIRVDFENLHARARIGESQEWTIDGSGDLAENRIETSGTVLRGPNDSRIEIDGRWDLAKLDNGKANLRISNFSADSIPLLQPNLSGLSALSGSIGIERSGGKWSISHDLATDLGSVKGVVEIEKTPAGSNVVRLDSGFTDLRVHISSVLPESRLNGHVKIEAETDGANLLGSHFEASIDPSVIGAESIDKCDFNGTFEKGVLTVNTSEGKCSLADFRFSLIADLRGLSDSGHKGVIKAEVGLAKGNLAKIHSGLSQQLGGMVSVEANYTPGNFTNPRLWRAKLNADLNIPDTLSLKGAGTYENESIKADYNVDVADVQKAALFFPQWKGKGRVVSRGTLTGKLRDLSWDGEINSPRLQYSDNQADQLSVKGRGSIAAKDARHELSLKAQNITLGGKRFASLNVDLDQEKNSCSFRLKGDGIFNELSTRLSGKVERIWEFPQMSVSTQGQVDWKELGANLDAKFDVEKDGVRIHSMSIQQGGQKIVVSGGGVSESKVDLALVIESLNAALPADLLGFKDRVSGTVSGQIQVNGRPDQPECRLNLKGADFVISGKQKLDALMLQGSYSKDMLTVQGTCKSATVQNPITISAKVPVRLSFKPPQFEVKLSDEFNSDIKVSGLESEALLPFLGFLSKVGGKLEGDIHCAGSLKQPVVTAAGTWKNGLFQEKNWTRPFENIEAEWQADSKNLYVKKAELAHLGGAVTVTGQVDYPRFKTFDFKAEGRDLQVPDIYGISGKVSGHAEIKASPEQAELTGTLTFSNAQMSLGKLETDIAQNIQIIEPNAKGDMLELKTSKHPSQFANRLSMEVKLELPESGTWVTGKGLKAEIGGGLMLKKEPAEPVRLVGELNAIRGVYSFQGKELKIVEGSLVFVGTAQAEPQLRILCQKDVRDITVQALVSGPLSRPKLVLSSIPAMNQMDILSYFIFDRPAGDLGSGQSSQLQSGAAAWLGSESSNVIKGVLGNNAFAPDRVGYRSYTGKYDHRFSYDQSQAVSGKETGIVEIGKDITQDLQVVYGREVNGEEGNEVQVEYRATRSLSVKTQVGAEQSGVDIFWRHDFGK